MAKLLEIVLHFSLVLGAGYLVGGWRGAGAAFLAFWALELLTTALKDQALEKAQKQAEGDAIFRRTAYWDAREKMLEAEWDALNEAIEEYQRRTKEDRLEGERSEQYAPQLTAFSIELRLLRARQKGVRAGRESEKAAGITR